MIFTLFQKYTEISTCNGVKYFGRTDIFIGERMFWVFTTFTFIGLATTVGRILFFKFMEKPIEITVEDTNVPLPEFPFPAVTICPTNNINIEVAKEYLSRFMNESDKITNNTIYDVISALYLLKYPTYMQMKRYLKSSRKYLRRFDDMNITDFMLAVLPSCKDLMNECFWTGKKEDCCNIFTIQPTEEGFCYTFNDFTTAEKQLCPIYDGSGNYYDEEERVKCQPRVLTFSGMYSGLTVFTKSTKPPENFLKDNQSFYPGLSILVSTAYEYPDAGSGNLLQTLPGQALQLEVKPVMLQSHDKLSRIAKEDRMCMLKAESEVLLTKYYSQSSCYLTCRHNFIIRMCRCQLYFFYEPSRKIPLCKVSQLLCIAKYSYTLQMKAPSAYSFSKPHIKDYPDCPCQAGCEGTWYDLAVKTTNITTSLWKNVTGLIDIYYAQYGAIKYKRQLTFTGERLLGPMPSVTYDGSTVRNRKLNRILSIDKAYLKQHKKIKSYGLLKEFTQSSTIHGIQHIFREGETPLHRLIWTIFFTVCLSGATYLINDSWTGYITLPIAVTVSDTNYPLDGVHFPAVSVCPTRKIVKTKAIEYLTEKLGNWVRNEQKIVFFLQALSELQHPLYHNMAEFLNSSQDILPKLENINITDLMINSLPPCNEIFLACYWQGEPQNCCALFSYQRSEEGFCYSFNSFTSERHNSCIYKDGGVSKENCTLFSTANTGPRSGVELLLKEVHKVTVRVHHPNEYPEAGMGSLIPVGDLDKMNIGVKPTITESADTIRALSYNVTGCYFKDSKDSYITRIYSQKSCLLECRMNFLLRKCNCLPYYITMNKKSHSCNATQLHCIVGSQEDLRFFRPPSDSSKVSDEVKKKSLDCTHCLPTCNERQYDLVIDHTKDTTARKRNYHAYVDVFYRSAGAVKYTRNMTYDYVQLLVNLGGIGGLFLGGSLLSLLEAVYWLSKAFLTYVCPASKKKLIASKQAQTKTVFSTNQAWLN